MPKRVRNDDSKRNMTAKSVKSSRIPPPVALKMNSLRIDNALGDLSAVRPSNVVHLRLSKIKRQERKNNHSLGAAFRPHSVVQCRHCLVAEERAT